MSCLVRFFLALVGASLVVLSSARAEAQLSLDALQELEAYAYCEQKCGYGKRTDFPACLSKCGSRDSAWDLDRDGDVDRLDHGIALRRFWGEPDCAGADAASLACRDEDNDGLRKWQEAALGTVDEPGTASAQTPCTNGVACGFAAACTFANPQQRDAIPLDVGYCATRPGCESATAASCTAFRLQLVEATDQEVVVHVVFDHAPVDARILDLHVRVPRQALKLTNARALPILTDAGKTLQVRQTGFDAATTSELRVIIMGDDATRPIPKGAVAELVFTRLSPTQSGTLTFATDNAIQRRALAPNPDPTPNDGASPLEADHLWGAPIRIDPVGAATPKLALHYTFDDRALGPQSRLVPTEDEACGMLYECDAKLRFKYSAMQRGVVEGESGIEGVSGPGLFLDGFSDHLELPVVFDDVTLRDDDFSVSFWFYHEGDRRGTGASEQILFAHNADTNKSGFGVALRSLDAGTFALDWFEGDRRSADTTRVELASGLPDRMWLYFAASIKNNGAGGATVSAHVRHPTEPGLSQTKQLPLTDLVKGCLGTQQGKLALVEPLVKREAIFHASSRNNLFGIARMDPNGMSQADVLRDLDSTALDPDFHPGNGKVVFVSSRTGDYEIWLANADGTEPVQVTSGFGGTAAGRFARHPRWSPDGRAIVFESNAFSRQRHYNTLARGYQLYYVAYDPTAGRIVVPQPSGDAATLLDFRTIEQLDVFYQYTLSGVDGANASNRYNFTQAHWLGNGRLVANRASERFDNAELVWFDIANVPAAYQAESRIARGIDGEPYAVPDGDAKLLAAGLRDGKARTLFAEELSRYESAEGTYAVSSPSWSGDEVSVRVTYTRDPESLPDYCWDRNMNRVCDAETENSDGVGTCTKLDCQPAELRDLFVLYDEDLEPVTDPITGRLLADTSAWIRQNKPVAGKPNGGLEVTSRYASSGAYLMVQVLSETSATPIPQDTHIATLRFRLKQNRARSDVAAPFSPLVRKIEQQLRLAETGQPTLRVDLSGGSFERVNSAAFSPDLERVVLAGIQDARPVVATSDALDFSLRNADDPRVEGRLSVISSAPMRVEGLSWRSFDTAFNCNWMGSYRNPTSGMHESSFRGGLDEVRYYDAARETLAIDSEFERGVEWLRAAKRLGAISARNAVCSSHLDCAAYEQCWDRDGDGSLRCDQRPCTTQSDCGLEGSCRLMPVPTTQDRTANRFVCAIDCQSSSQCYEQECLNGPCMFCQAGTCAECRRMTGEFGIEYIEGCPDRNSFSCEQGSCLSECYSFENQTSRYLCDPASQYCRQGKCVLFDWDWPDLSPATFSGMGEMLSVNHGSTPADPLIYTEATAQFHTVQLEAYGVGDYLNAPEVSVQVHGASMYGGDGWFELGRVLVHNKTRGEAENRARRYRLTSPYPFDAVRLRLVTPPYSNMNGAATGLGTRLAAQCAGDARHCASREQTNPGSRAYLGYRIGIPEYVARAQRPGQDQLLASQGLQYLYGGQTAVIVSKVLVGSVSSESELNLTSLPSCAGATSLCAEDRVCPYAGGASDTNPARAANGAALTPAAVRAYGNDPRPFDMASQGFGLLNCVWNPVPAPGQEPRPAAELVIRNIPKHLFVGAQSGRPDDNKHIETPNSCFVEIDVGGEKQRIPCFETSGSDPNIDPYNLESQAYRTLDIDTFQSFGYELEQFVEGSP
jgi:hypothetical protein